MLNRYGRIAHDHWKKYRPKGFSNIDDPIAHFNMMGEEIDDKIEEIVSGMCPKSPLEYLQMSNLIESEVLRGVLPIDEETEALTEETEASPAG